MKKGISARFAIRKSKNKILGLDTTSDTEHTQYKYLHVNTATIRSFVFVLVALDVLTRLLLESMMYSDFKKNSE